MPTSPFGRTFIGSLPLTTSLAWIILGNQPTNLAFPQTPCPLLCDPDVVGGLRLGPVSGGRRIVEFEDELPAIPGASWFTQAVGFGGGTFVGTNGVHIRT